MEVKNNALHPPLGNIWPHGKPPNPLAKPLEPCQSSWVWISARFWNCYHISHTPMVLPMKGLCCGKDYVCVRWHQYIQRTLKYDCSFQFWCPTPSVWGHRNHWSPSHHRPRKNRVHLQHPHIWSRKGEELITWNEMLPCQFDWLNILWFAVYIKRYKLEIFIISILHNTIVGGKLTVFLGDSVHVMKAVPLWKSTWGFTAF